MNESILEKKKSPLKRAVAKSFTWKVTGVVTLALISWILGIDLEIIGKLTIFYHVVTLFLFVIHERIWSKIKYGKKKKVIVC